MSDDQRDNLRRDLEGWIEERLSLFVGDDPAALPIVCDFCLTFAWEDGADRDSPTSFESVSSYVPSYRIWGLLTAVRERFRVYRPGDDD